MKQELKTPNEEHRIQAKAPKNQTKNYKRPLTQKQGYFRWIFHLIGAISM